MRIVGNKLAEKVKQIWISGKNIMDLTRPELKFSLNGTMHQNLMREGKGEKEEVQ